MALVNCETIALWNNVTEFVGVCGIGKSIHGTPLANAGNQLFNNDVHKQNYVSSNGYYGYIPKTSVFSECEMDTSSDVNSSYLWSNDKSSNCAANVFLKRRVYKEVNNNVYIDRSGLKRKLDYTGSIYGEPKRPRHEASISKCNCGSDTDINVTNLKKEELNLVEKMLKELHGCDMYNYFDCEL
ncbi:unnamed protein product [Timema podura]|uniref:Uncharacterized protein n=1 Tax=Timema podura TaxID=61482 RepID=A0ABN7PBX8_TIMPD|nr:unnamed protein product [Timema podura]